MKTFLAAREMSHFFGQNAEVRAAKKLTSDICRKILITKSYPAKPKFEGYEIKTGGEISSHVHCKTCKAYQYQSNISCLQIPKSTGKLILFPIYAEIEVYICFSGKLPIREGIRTKRHKSLISGINDYEKGGLTVTDYQSMILSVCVHKTQIC